MKVLLINGSPHPEGCTYTALSEVAKTLNGHDIQTQIYQMGDKPIAGCVGCGACYETGYCVYPDDGVNDCIDLMEKADGLVVGSPVYFASPNGSLISFLDRMFFCKAHKYENKPAAAIVNARRGGSSAAHDVLNKYFTISNMPVVSSQYWNQTYGLTPDEVRKDLEGLQTMRTLAHNMAWLLKSLHAAKDKVASPVREDWIPTNFIR